MISDTSSQDTVLTTPKSSQRRRWLLLGTCGFVLIFVLSMGARAWLSGDRSVSASRLQIATVTRGILVRDAAVTGRVIAAVSPTLYAPLAATVNLRTHAGDHVNKDDVLAELDSPELNNELARERSTLQQLDAEVGSARIGSDRQRLSAQRESDEAQIALQAAARDLQRIERGWKLGALPEIDDLRAQDTLKSAEIRNRNASAAARLATQSAGFDLQTKVRGFERQKLVVADLERRVDQLKVRAPVSGVIGTLAVADRAVVPANATLMTVVDLSRLEVELSVPETYADDLGIGMGVEVSLGTSKFPGKLSALSPEVVDHEVLARVRFDGTQPPGLRQNERVSARVLIEDKPNVLMLPRGPFIETDGGNFAYVVEGGTAERRPVRIGATSVDSVEVVSGLVEGPRVVVAGTDAFQNAAHVSIH